MKDTKRRLEIFSFLDYTGIARHLSKMAEKGWLIEKISPFGWTYRRIIPKKLTFFVSYYPQASEFDPEPAEQQKTFHDFCEYTGWRFTAASAQMQIFYNEQENPTPIETDPVLEVETIHAAAKKSFLPAYFAWLAVAILDMVLFIGRMHEDLIGLLASATNLFTGFGWSMLFIICIIELCGYFIWHAKAKKAAEYGEWIESPNHSHIQKIILTIVVLGFLYWFFTSMVFSTAMLRIITIAIFLYVIALFLLVNGIKQLLKRKKVARNINRAVTLASSFILSFVMITAITYGILHISKNGLFEQNQTDELPLTVEDLLDINYEGYIKERRSEESLLLGQFFMHQFPKLDSEHYTEMPWLAYTITEVRVHRLYDFCKNSLLDGYAPVDPKPWRANEAYKHDSNTYLLCYENRIIEITFDWEPTTEQMGIAADAFLREENYKL